MLLSDDSDDEQEIEFNNILYEDSKEEEIDYFNDTLPHINFYLKFQNKFFLQNFCNELKVITEDAKKTDTNSGLYEKKHCYQNQKGEQNEQIDQQNHKLTEGKREREKEKEKERDPLKKNIKEIRDVESQMETKKETGNNVETIAKGIIYKGYNPKENFGDNINLLSECGFCIDDTTEEEKGILANRTLENRTLENRTLENRTLENRTLEKDSDINSEINSDIHSDIKFDINFDINSKINTKINNKINSEIDLEKKEIPEKDTNKNGQNELEASAKKEAADLCKRLEEIFQTKSLHLDEHEEYTKKINFLFQNCKSKFTFSIERELLTNEQTNEQTNKKCFICNQKKKNFNKVLNSANIYLCYECKLLDNNFRMISLSKLINKYCLNNQDLLKYEKQLIILSTKNPRGYAKQMKLFFLFQIKEIAIRKHGSLLNTQKLYHEKICNVKKAKSPKKTIHKWKKTKTIYSKEAEINEKQKIICDDDTHSFDEPICIDPKENVYKKSCNKCSFCVEYMQI